MDPRSECVETVPATRDRRRSGRETSARVQRRGELGLEALLHHQRQLRVDVVPNRRGVLEHLFGHRDERGELLKVRRRVVERELRTRLLGTFRVIV
jgi:hypothetical protein